MAISEPGKDSLILEEKHGRMSVTWPLRWITWFTEVWRAVMGWKTTYYATLTHDFGNINAQTQATQTATVTGARSGDVVIVRPTTAVNGIIIDGTVTADNTVTIRAVNYSSGAIDPAEQSYKILVFQQ